MSEKQPYAEKLHSVEWNLSCTNANYHAVSYHVNIFFQKVSFFNNRQFENEQ